MNKDAFLDKLDVRLTDPAGIEKGQSNGLGALGLPRWRRKREFVLWRFNRFSSLPSGTAQSHTIRLF
ncbi:MAG: hypothetical protein WCB23_02875, partial [Pseudolabrys sp.]